MSLRKKDIVKHIHSEADLTYSESSLFLETFLNIIKFRKAKIKIPNFGVFYIHASPGRVGRNPITKKEYPISARGKLAFKASKNLKENIN